MTIIDRIIAATAEQYRVRLILDPHEAERLGCKVGECVRERIPRPYIPELELR